MTQSLLEAHGFLHAPPEHTYGVHVACVCIAHVPIPLQNWPVTWFDALQSAAPHVVPLGTNAHEPGPVVVPLHCASCPHGLLESSTHCPPGFEPALAGPHVPSAIPDCL